MTIKKTQLMITEIVNKSQHCQRNWDLSKKIPKEDLNTILHSVTQCPSKQNHAFYRVYAITNREVIEQIHKNTQGFLLDNGEWTTNSQTLANLLLAFGEVSQMSEEYKTKHQYYENNKNNTNHRDVNMSVGIAAGYANLTATMLGYQTGFCACFDVTALSQILNIKNKIILLMGIGFGNPDRNRRHHHDTNQLYPTKIKENIEIIFVE
jgi:nitroreductase